MAEAGFVVESEWPKTPHSLIDPQYDSERERYTTRTVEFFKKVVRRQGDEPSQRYGTVGWPALSAGKALIRAKTLCTYQIEENQDTCRDIGYQ